MGDGIGFGYTRSIDLSCVGAESVSPMNISIANSPSVAIKPRTCFGNTICLFSIPGSLQSVDLKMNMQFIVKARNSSSA